MKLFNVSFEWLDYFEKIARTRKGWQYSKDYAKKSRRFKRDTKGAFGKKGSGK